MIEHLNHSEIDKLWWDQQLLRCGNRMWYAQSWVLDRTSPGWEALVDRSSGALMPLTWRRKLFFKYLFQPYGTQQLGVFAVNYTNALGHEFIQTIPRKFSFCDIALNESMNAMKIDGVRFTPLDQQVLPLDRSVEEIRAGYSTGHRRNLRKAGDDPPVIRDIEASEFTKLFIRTTAERFKSGGPKEYAAMNSVIEHALKIGQCTILGLRSGGTLCAAACFMEWQGRAIFYKSAADEKGQRMMGMFRIIDHYIGEHAPSNILLDLAGSNTPSVARFNSGFGAQGRIYLRLQRNDLPFPFKWFKQ